MRLDLYRPRGVVSLTDWGGRPRAGCDQYGSQTRAEVASPGPPPKTHRVNSGVSARSMSG